MRHHILFAALGQVRPAAPNGGIRNDGKVELTCRSAGTVLATRSRSAGSFGLIEPQPSMRKSGIKQ